MSYADMEQQLANSRDAFVKNQRANIDSTYSNQVNELEKSYSQAVADGNISVRDANDQFNQQKSALEQSHYQNAQKTMLYGQNMGLQNSQQMIGLIQGEQAKSNQLVNQNVVARDKRLADIKDRLDAITKQKNLDITNATHQRDLGYTQAQATADSEYAKGMFSVKQMKQQLEDQMRLQAQQFANQSRLQSQSVDNQIKLASKQAEQQMKAEQDAYEKSRARELAKYTPGTPEYNIRANQLAEQFQQKINDIHTGTMYNFVAKNVLEDPALKGSTSKPQYDNAIPRLGNFLGTAVNQLTGYDANMKNYNSTMDAISRKNSFLSNPSAFLPNPYGALLYNSSTKDKTPY